MAYLDPLLLGGVLFATVAFGLFRFLSTHGTHADRSVEQPSPVLRHVSGIPPDRIQRP